MKKMLDIAFKDLKETFQNIFSLVMMLGAPLLVTGLLYFAFGGIASDGGDYNLPTTRVQVVNLDQGTSRSGGFIAGDLLLTFLNDEEIQDVMEFSSAPDEDTARRAVETGKSDIALIIPAKFTEAALSAGESVEILLYQDPTLTIGPKILQDLLVHFLDGFSGSKIAASVTSRQLKHHGVSGDIGGVSNQYAAWLENSGHTEGESGITFLSPSGQETETDPAAAMIGPIMSGMTIFFIFFMAANGTQTIIREYEEGTLARLFTTPTSPTRILGGKFLGVFLTIIIQALLLLTASRFIFGISWGRPGTVILVTTGLLVAAAGFGILIISFIENTRQTGPVLGGALTLTGMLGGLFTNGIPNLPPLMDKARLIMPQGWAMTAFEAALNGAHPTDVLLPVGVLFLMGAVFFIIGALIFSRRFAA